MLQQVEIFQGLSEERGDGTLFIGERHKMVFGPTVFGTNPGQVGPIDGVVPGSLVVDAGELEAAYRAAPAGLRQVAPVASGLGAKLACSHRYLTGLPPEQIAASAARKPGLTEEEIRTAYTNAVKEFRDHGLIVHELPLEQEDISTHMNWQEAAYRLLRDQREQQRKLLNINLVELFEQ